MARFEVLTPFGPGGVAVVAIRGADRFAVASRCLAGHRGAMIATADRPRLALLRVAAPRSDAVEVSDQVLVVDRPAIATLELHLHGSPVVLRGLAAAVGGFAPAPLGRAETAMQSARSRAELAFALEQRELDWDRFWAAVAGCASPAERRAALAAAVERSRTARALLEPRRVVICGDQNAGKSTLMNRLLFRERVVTGALPGLTRDPVQDATVLDGYPYEIVDTAGEGEVVETVDCLALARGRDARREGIQMLVIDGSRVPSASDRRIRDDNTLVVRNKNDLCAAAWPADFAADLAVSCIDPRSAAAVRASVGRVLRLRRGLPAAGPVGGIAALDATERGQLAAAWRDEYGTELGELET